MANPQEFTKYERARILGARGLQVSMDAPLLVKIDEAELIAMNHDPLKIAEQELDSGVLPITVNRPLPAKGSEEEIKKIKIDETTLSDEKKIKEEAEAEKDIMENNEMLGASDEESEEKASVAPAPSQEPSDDQIE
jgi:DNA-directed RNA polymerase subunit K/omega